MTLQPSSFMSEPVFTNTGAIIPPVEFFPAIENICRQHGILFIMDEVATGFGRCGRLFGSELWELEPDIICLGKGITGGYGTLGATIVTEDIYEQCRGKIPSYSTFGWTPLDLAAARANVEVILQGRLWENADEVGLYLLGKLKALELKPNVGEVRGIGLLLGIELVSDCHSKRPDFKRATEVLNKCSERGLLLGSVGNVLLLTPALTLSYELADEGAAIITSLL
jgi:4-aminobutyrate aminotransferase-like enzyme